MTSANSPKTPRKLSFGQKVFFVALGMSLTFSVLVCLFVLLSGWFSESFSEALLMCLASLLPAAVVIGLRRLADYLFNDVLKND